MYLLPNKNKDKKGFLKWNFILENREGARETPLRSISDLLLTTLRRVRIKNPVKNEKKTI